MKIQHRCDNIPAAGQISKALYVKITLTLSHDVYPRPGHTPRISNTLSLFRNYVFFFLNCKVPVPGFA
jgi:hypothetical protein